MFLRIFFFIRYRWLDFYQLRIWTPTPPLPPFRSGHFYFSSYGRFYLQFTAIHLDFQVCRRPKKIFQKRPNLQERWAMSWNEWKINFTVFMIFGFGDIVDFVLKFRKTEILRPPNYLTLNSSFFRGLPPNHASRRVLRSRTPDYFGLNPPNQLVLGYHRLAFLNQVHVSTTKISFSYSKMAKNSGKMCNALKQIF